MIIQFPGSALGNGLDWKNVHSTSGQKKGVDIESDGNFNGYRGSPLKIMHSFIDSARMKHCFSLLVAFVFLVLTCVFANGGNVQVLVDFSDGYD